MTAMIRMHTMIISTILVIVLSVDGQLDCEGLLHRCPDKTARTGTVCGNDGRNYRHLCHLHRRKCKMDLPMLEFAHFNKCKVAVNKECPRKCESGTRTSKVCGTDGRTYATACAVKRRICRVDPHLAILHPGRCEDLPVNYEPPAEEHVEEVQAPEEETGEIEVVDEKDATKPPPPTVEDVIVEIIYIVTELPDEN